MFEASETDRVQQGKLRFTAATRPLSHVIVFGELSLQMVGEKCQSSLNNFSCASIIIENIKAMLTIWMIHQGKGDVALDGNATKLIKRFVEKGAIFTVSPFHPPLSLRSLSLLQSK